MGVSNKASSKTTASISVGSCPLTHQTTSGTTFFTETSSLDWLCNGNSSAKVTNELIAMKVKSIKNTLDNTAAPWKQQYLHKLVTAAVNLKKYSSALATNLFCAKVLRIPQDVERGPKAFHYYIWAGATNIICWRPKAPSATPTYSGDKTFTTYSVH